jgi:hypothetical protein
MEALVGGLQKKWHKTSERRSRRKEQEEGGGGRSRMKAQEEGAGVKRKHREGAPRGEEGQRGTAAPSKITRAGPEGTGPARPLAIDAACV